MSDIERSLDEHLTASQPDDGLGFSLWAADVRAAALTRIRERSEAAAERRALIDDWLTQANKADEATIERMNQLLIEQHRARIAGQVDAGVEWSKVQGKTLELPGVRVAAKRSSSGRVEFEDQDRFIAMVEEHGASGYVGVDYVPKVSITALRKAAEEGDHVVLDDHRFYLRTGPDSDDLEALPARIVGAGEVTYTTTDKDL